MDTDRRLRIIDALKSRVNRPCERCGESEFDILAETEIALPNERVAEGDVSVLPVVLVACQNCGNITQHATGRLNLGREVAHSA